MGETERGERASRTTQTEKTGVGAGACWRGWRKVPTDDRKSALCTPRFSDSSSKIEVGQGFYEGRWISRLAAAPNSAMAHARLGSRPKCNQNLVYTKGLSFFLSFFPFIYFSAISQLNKLFSLS